MLSRYLPSPWDGGLREDAFCNLSRCFAGDFEAYDQYMNYFYNGIDPMDNDEKTALMFRLRDGVDDSTYYHLLPEYKLDMT